jgi:hypothetical protein
MAKPAQAGLTEQLTVSKEMEIVKESLPNKTRNN